MDQILQDAYQLAEDIGKMVNAEWIDPNDVLSLDEYIDPNDVEEITDADFYEDDNFTINLVRRCV